MHHVYALLCNDEVLSPAFGAEAVWANLLSVVSLTAVPRTRELTLTFSDADDLMARDATQKIYNQPSLAAFLLFSSRNCALFCLRFLSYRNETSVNS